MGIFGNTFKKKQNHFYSEDLWSRVGREQFHGKLHHGETVYYEIVGYTQDGAFIQKGYDYGCLNGEYKIFVYRITYTTPSGTVVELQWNQVKGRCAELGVAHVPEIFYGVPVHDFWIDPVLPNRDESVAKWQNEYIDFLKRGYVYDQDCHLCANKVPAEGICVRKEGLDIEVFKLKNWRFLEHETKMLDENVTDIETTQSE